MKNSIDYYLQAQEELTQEAVTDLVYDVGFFIIHYGLGFTYEDIITYYQANKNKHISANYFILLVSILQSLGEERREAWTNTSNSKKSSSQSL